MLYRVIYSKACRNIKRFALYLSIVVYLVKARTGESEKQPLLCNDCEMGEYTRAVSGQRLGKHFPAETNNATVGLQQWKRGVSTVVRAEMI
jgi:hypothetical protein